MNSRVRICCCGNDFAIGMDVSRPTGRAHCGCLNIILPRRPRYFGLRIYSITPRPDGDAEWHWRGEHWHDTEAFRLAREKQRNAWYAEGHEVPAELKLALTAALQLTETSLSNRCRPAKAA